MYFTMWVSLYVCLCLSVCLQCVPCISVLAGSRGCDCTVCVCVCVSPVCALHQCASWLQRLWLYGLWDPADGAGHPGQAALEPSYCHASPLPADRTSTNTHFLSSIWWWCHGDDYDDSLPTPSHIVPCSAGVWGLHGSGGGQSLPAPLPPNPPATPLPGWPHTHSGTHYN